MKKENKIQFKSRKEATIFLAEKGIDTSNWSDLNWLKINKGQADIHMMFLAEAIYDAMNESTPRQLKEGEWHIPYGDNMDYEELGRVSAEYYKNNPNEIVDVNKWLCQVSIARCARLSYQTLGDNPVIDYEADLKLYEILTSNGHASPTEHVARAMTNEEYNSYVKGKVVNQGTDLMPMWVLSNEAKGWCRNFQGFIQYRELLD